MVIAKGGVSLKVAFFLKCVNISPLMKFTLIMQPYRKI